MTHIEAITMREQHAAAAEKAADGEAYRGNHERGTIHALLAIYYELVARDA